MTQGIRLAALLLLGTATAWPAFSQAPGENVYEKKCAMCHGADGLATTPTAKNFKVASFKAPEMMKASDAQFITSTRDGKGKMPAYKDKLTDEQIKDVTAFIRSLQR
jgi:cytochrome c6